MEKVMDDRSLTVMTLRLDTVKHKATQLSAHREKLVVEIKKVEQELMHLFGEKRAIDEMMLQLSDKQDEKNSESKS